MGEPGAWEIRSDTTKSALLGVGLLLVGSLFIFLTHGQAAHNRDMLAAFWLGVLLAGLGVGSLILSEDTVLTVDPAKRMLRFQRKGRWYSTVSHLHFGAVASVGVARVGSGSGHTPSHFLVLHLKNGKVEATGRWSLDPMEIQDLAQHLAEAIGCECRAGRPAPSTAAKHLPVAALGAVLAYALWFRLQVGPWCPAMWFGTAPPVIMVSVFGILLGLFRRFWR